MTNNQSPLVLLVEDNYLIKKISTILLKQLNCIVDVASNGKETLEFIQEKKYNIIFMDIGLPDIDGITLIQKIRKLSKINCNVPVIALTAHSDHDYMTKSLDAGANEFLTKPFNMQIGQHLLQRYYAAS